LLILVSAFYVLPVKEAVYSFDQVCMMDMEEAKEESAKKEKSKELFSFNISFGCQPDPNTCTHQPVPVLLPLQHHLVETPPPDAV